MKKLLFATAAASLAILAISATVAAAGPAAGRGPAAGAGVHRGTTTVAGGATGTAGAGRAGNAAQPDVIAGILGMTQAQIDAGRQAGESLAQIAQKKGIDPQKLVDALVAQWSTRIDYRVSVGALTTAHAATLRDQLVTRAKDMVYRVTVGGMQGGAVGAGPNGTGTDRGARNGMNAGNGRGRGAGNGACDGTGPLASPQA